RRGVPGAVRGVSEGVRLLLVAQGDGGVQPGGACRRVDAEEEPDPAGDADGERDRPGRNLRRKRRGEPHDGRGSVADGDADEATAGGEHHRLDDELRKDARTAGAKRLAQADLAGPL